MRMNFFSFIFTVFLEFNHCTGYDGPIAGNKTISECMKGSKSKLSDREIIPVINFILLFKI